MHDKYSCFSFCLDDYRESSSLYGEKEVDYIKMFSDISDVLRIGLKNGYQFHVHSDGYCIMLDYNYDSPEMAGCTLEWIGDDEYIGNYKEDAKHNSDPGEKDDL